MKITEWLVTKFLADQLLPRNTLSCLARSVNWRMPVEKVKPIGGSAFLNR
jgi:hypothetical protein